MEKITDIETFRKRESFEEINQPNIKKTKSENSKEDIVYLKENEQSNDVNDNLNSETKEVKNNNVNIDLNVKELQNENEEINIQNDNLDEKLSNFEKCESQIQHLIEKTNDNDGVDNIPQDNKIEQQSNNLFEENNLNTEIKPETSQDFIYQFPIYEFKKETTLRSTDPIYNPRCSTHDDFSNNFEINNYFKGAKWSPDGTCILTSSNDNNLRIFELPDISNNKIEEINIKPALKVCDGESVYDYCWYPYMNSSDPSTSVFISASRDLPIHMWDAYYGTIRASYCTYDIYDQIVAPHSINFNLDGSKIFAGLNNLIQIFDISRPGQPINKKMTTPTRKSKHGQKGIISCMDFNPDYSGLLAAGSLSKSIGIYDTNNSNELVYQQKKLKGGVIQVQFSPDGNYLYSVSRQTDGIICWDIRNTGKQLCEYVRPGKTNQRISFDISKDGKYLISGDKDGYINVYELMHVIKSPEALEELNNQKIEFKSIKPTYRYEVNKDTITSVAFHPYYPIIFTCSGQRKFNMNILDEHNVENCAIDSTSEHSTTIEDSQKEIINYKCNYSENILSIWQIGTM
ncbi:WD40 repeat-like protein [Piromyces finnis]|uniref:WD40 repeat-like protein n=1 Tax=Piromyces finnis TaxID=1754191 RepID=A0A1Y1VP33_9FUNG|nr:WD40 repeat-like protein [Piromyces finnis]|eukprot:ORX60912.1 WD40 repeat-like protein [Piromyces finnis]